MIPDVSVSSKASPADSKTALNEPSPGTREGLNCGLNAGREPGSVCSFTPEEESPFMCLGGCVTSVPEGSSSCTAGPCLWRRHTRRRGAARASSGTRESRSSVQTRLSVVHASDQVATDRFTLVSKGLALVAAELEQTAFPVRYKPVPV